GGGGERTAPHADASAAPRPAGGPGGAATDETVTATRLRIVERVAPGIGRNLREGARDELVETRGPAGGARVERLDGARDADHRIARLPCGIRLHRVREPSVEHDLMARPFGDLGVGI